MLKLLYITPSFSSSSASSASANAKPTKALDFFEYQQIFPGDKTQHFTRIQQSSKVAYEDMVFFDDEARNRNVERELGVTFVLVKDGVTKDEVDRGVRDWRKRRGLGRAADGEVEETG